MTETSNVQELQIKVWDHDLLIKADPEVFSSCINCIFGKKQALFNGCKLMQYENIIRKMRRQFTVIK